ncbi:hypothetical protein [Burkholderia gladioli]|uniref:hypothetical protein n=1 Tax=Burkholderia gladioli TaxID=28095 RepID=UPI00163FF8FC|nr:hypothetical protein [Burkholderia gladioli]
MKRTFLVRALLGAAIPMMMAEDVPAATQAAPEGGAPVGESATSQPGAAVTVLELSGEALVSGTAAAPLESSGTSAIPTAAAASSISSSSSGTTTLSTAAAPDTSSTAGQPAPTTAASSSAPVDATLADAGGIPPTAAPALDPALGQIPTPVAEPAAPAETAAAPASPIMFEIHAAAPDVAPIRIYADGHVDGLPDGYQITINRGHAVAAELESLKADDRHLSLLASWHKEMEVLGRGLSGEVTRLLGETKKYLEDVL